MTSLPLLYSLLQHILILHHSNFSPPAMHLMRHSPLLTSILILLALLFPCDSSSQSVDLELFSQDFGRIIEESPISVLRPTTPADISLLLKSISSSPIQNNVTVAPRGAGHSTYGQAQAPAGIVIDMTRLPSSIQVENTYVDAGGGTLWVDVLTETLKHGLTPRTLTDYLYLTVGGTLSNAGIGGQAFKYGPQISNVIELDVVTGKGEQITCSEHVNSDIFYGILGGLGQFGMITRARILLEPAPTMVKRVEVLYDDFDQFTKDQEFLFSKGEVDYLEGSINIQVNTLNVSKNEPTESGPNPSYSIELAIYYNDTGTVQKILDRVLSQLGSARSTTVKESDVPYFEFLDRVRGEEEKLRKIGFWEVPHPWFILFVPKAHIRRFKDLLVETISDSYIGGPIIMYPFLRHKWNLNMSVVLPRVYPKEDVVYVVSVLQSAALSCGSGSQCLDTFLSQNRKVIDIATSEPEQEKTPNKNRTTPMATNAGGMGAKQYLPYWKNEDEWRGHFGDKWDRFKELKNKFDPLHILTPGQRIFKRQPILVES